MWNKNLLILLLGLIAPVCFAQETSDSIEYNTNSFRQAELLSPWLNSGNAAGMGQMANYFPGVTDVGFEYQNGDFKNVFQGKNQETYHLGSKNYQKTRKTVLFGEFTYRKGFEHNLDFTNLNTPQNNQPYILTDTIGNDTYNSEFFNLSGAISAPVNDQLDWGFRFDYEVGIAAQDRDPRPENKVLKLNISPGLLWKLPKVNFGMNLNYEYYDEDISVKTIKANTDYSMFRMHGLGTSTYESASSFNRQYKQQKFGGGTQISFKSGNIETISTGKVNYLDQRIDDAGNASWAIVKNDAKLIGLDYELTNITSLKKERKVQQLVLKMNLADRLGTEFIQRLEKVGETDLEKWVTYGTEDKYYSSRMNFQAKYNQMVLAPKGQIASLFTIGLSSAAFLEKYYLPNLEQKYQNLLLNTSWLRSFFFSNKTVSVELRMGWQTNLSNSQNVMKNSYLAEKIIQPEFDFATADYLATGTSVAYEIPWKRKNKYFIKTDLDWAKSNHDRKRSCLNFSTGIIF
jgi:hypothetical protein